MKDSSERMSRFRRGVAALYDDYERKELFKKYLFFLGWVEVAIFAACWIYQLGDGGYDRFGPVDLPFPWKTYFMIAFLAPIAITFLVGVVIVGFNQYFGESDPAEEPAFEPKATEIPLEERTGRAYKLHKMVTWLQQLPFLGLLLLLGVAVGFFYKLDAILAFLGHVGQTSVKIVLISAAVLLALACAFAVVLIVLNYKLRKKSMEYQYKSEVAERFGLIILDDKTVLNSEGKLLLDGTQSRANRRLLPPGTAQAPKPERPTEPSPGAFTSPADLKTP